MAFDNNDSHDDEVGRRDNDAPAAWLKGVVGAVGGAAIGHFIHHAIAVSSGIVVIALPGAMAGIGCGLLARRRSVALGVGAAVVGLAAGIVSEWRVAPFIADASLTYFVAHLLEITPLGKIAIVVGTLAAYWLGVGRDTDR